MKLNTHNICYKTGQLICELPKLLDLLKRLGYCCLSLINNINLIKWFCVVKVVISGTIPIGGGVYLDAGPTFDLHASVVGSITVTVRIGSNKYGE